MCCITASHCATCGGDGICLTCAGGASVTAGVCPTPVGACHASNTECSTN